MPTRRLLLATVIPVLLFASGCSKEIYVVRQVQGTSVTCGAMTKPEKTFIREWDPIVQIAPEIGQEWLCNH